MKKLFFLIVILLLVLTFITTINIFHIIPKAPQAASIEFNSHEVSTPNPTITPTQQILNENAISQKIYQDELLILINNALPKDALIGLAIKDLNTNSTFGINQGLSLPAASVNKVTTAAYLLNEIYKGNRNLKDVVGWQTIEGHLTDLLKVSSNESWDELGNLVGWNNINNFGKLIGMKNTDLYENVTTAEDINTLYQAILTHKIASLELTTFFLNLMQNTETEDRIPTNLPKETVLYHKSGSIDTSINDGGIILLPNHPFIITVLTKDVSGGRGEASALIANITKITYDYLSSSPN